MTVRRPRKSEHTLKTVEAENRAATAEEQAVLAQYVGWGGLADFFDEKNPRYNELKDLLTDAEYAAARESTLTAFFTPPVVIRGIYAALGQMGFTQGNILEPSCGIGNFLGMLPEDMSGSKLYGVELDDLSGRIARQLYQKSSIVCLCHVVDLWACIVALFEAPTPLSISKLRRLADSDMPLILLSSEIMEKESDFRVIEL